MGVGLSYAEVGLLSHPHPTFGQTFYMVDSDYRTAAQGWSQADRTGPLDLYEARKAGHGGVQYVYRTEDYTDDTVALQAANDALVDFRGDALIFTPGAYSLVAAVTVDVPDARWLGPFVSHPTVARASITATVANQLAIGATADRMEFGYLEFIPLTAATMFDLAAVDKLHVHDCFHNADGIAASTATIFWAPATSVQHMMFERNYVWIDAAQGPWINCEGITKGLVVNDFVIVVEAGTWAAAIDFEGIGACNFSVGPGIITGNGTALTSLVTVADKTVDTTHGMVVGIRASTVGPAAGSLAVGTAAAEVDIVDCWRAVATDTAQPTFTSGGNISWESGVPYTG